MNSSPPNADSCCSVVAPKASSAIADVRGDIATIEDNLKEFAYFGQLPVELRLKIVRTPLLLIFREFKTAVADGIQWETAAHEPRVVDVWSIPYRTKSGNLLSNEVPPRWLSNMSNPALLAACIESRTEGLKYYELAFGTEYDSGGPCINPAEDCKCPKEAVVIDEPGTIYANWAVDVILLNCNWMLDPLEDDNIHMRRDRLFARHPQIRRLAIEESDSTSHELAFHMLPLDELILYSATDAFRQLPEANPKHGISLGLIDLAEDHHLMQEDGALHYCRGWTVKYLYRHFV